MTHRRGTVLLAGLIALVCSISLATGLPSASAATSGKPPVNAPISAGSFFSYPNKGASNQTVIRNRVINTINSTWGRYTVANPNDPSKPLVKRGKILMTTWSFNDQYVRNALVNAAKRGTTVRIIAAEGVNREKHYKPWSSLRTAINKTMRGWSGVDPTNIAGQCRGACRGSGGTPHSKYFLFDDVGSSHQRNIVVQTSMNLTPFAFKGQWNQATVWKSAGIYNHYAAVFAQSLQNRSRGSAAYVRKTISGVTDIFFPGGTLARDPVLYALNRVHCTGAKAGGVRGRTRVRVIQYAIYDSRGNAIAKKLRSLWNKGCDVRIIYSVSSRPVLKILRSRSSRGPIPMKQSVVKNGAGELVKYNHSKWLAIGGYYGTNKGTYTVLAGSTNWSNFGYSSDEQMQQFNGYSRAKGYFRNFSTTWAQGTSRTPSYGRVAPSAGARSLASVPEQPVFGEGPYKYLSEGE